MNKPLMENPTMRKSLRSTCRCVGVSMTLAVLMLACRAERLQVEPFMDEPRPVELINGPVGKALTSVRDSSLFGEGSILSESDVVGLGGPSCALGSVACGFSAINNELYWEGEGGTYFLSTGVGSVWARGVFEIFRGTATTSTGKVISCGYPVMKANVCSDVQTFVHTCFSEKNHLEIEVGHKAVTLMGVPHIGVTDTRSTCNPQNEDTCGGGGRVSRV